MSMNTNLKRLGSIPAVFLLLHLSSCSNDGPIQRTDAPKGTEDNQSIIDDEAEPKEQNVSELSSQAVKKINHFADLVDFEKAIVWNAEQVEWKGKLPIKIGPVLFSSESDIKFLSVFRGGVENDNGVVSKSDYAGFINGAKVQINFEKPVKSISFKILEPATGWRGSNFLVFMARDQKRPLQIERAGPVGNALMISVIFPIPTQAIVLKNADNLSFKSSSKIFLDELRLVYSNGTNGSVDPSVKPAVDPPLKIVQQKCVETDASDRTLLTERSSAIVASGIQTRSAIKLPKAFSSNSTQSILHLFEGGRYLLSSEYYQSLPAIDKLLAEKRSFCAVVSSPSEKDITIPAAAQLDVRSVSVEVPSNGRNGRAAISLSNGTRDSRSPIVDGVSVHQILCFNGELGGAQSQEATFEILRNAFSKSIAICR